MAGRGPAPKDPENRARTNAPERGEWLSLPPLVKPVLPPLPKPGRGELPWPARTRRLWDAWRADWATGWFGPGEVAMTIEAAYLHADTCRVVEDPETGRPTMIVPSSSAVAELRQWMDRLGLTPKGKRDLRLRLAEPAATSSSGPTPPTSPKSRERYGKLRAVG